MKICEAGRSSGCCSNPDIRTINTMGADTQGNFTIRGDQGIHVTVGTNEIIISGIAMYYDNTDGNIVIDNDLLTINLADDLAVTGNVSMGGDLGVTGDAVIAGNLTVNGTYYTVHAEHVYTQDDYIILREGATTPLAAGSYAGFQVTKYDGTNDGRLVVDNAGVARVGDVGDEQPLLTRDEAADLTDGDSLIWDSANSRAVTEAIPSAISTELAGKQNTLSTETLYEGVNVRVIRYGKIVHVTIYGQTTALNIPNMPQPIGSQWGAIFTSTVTPNGAVWIMYNSTTIEMNFNSNVASYGSLTYICQ